MIYFLFLSVFFGLMLSGVQPLFSFLLTCVVFLLGYTFKKMREWTLLMRMYNRLIDDIYVISKHPDQNWIASIPRFHHDKKILIIHAEYENVFKEVEKQKSLLKRSGNPFYMHPERVGELQAEGERILTPDEAVEVKYF